MSDLAAKLSWGLDLGSRFVKMVSVQRGPGSELYSQAVVAELLLVDTVQFYKDHGCHRQRKFYLDLDLSEKKPLGATGYGRENIAGAHVVGELSAHVAGACFQTGLSDFTMLDIGGQDTKIVKVAGGRMVDFETNDKCAASTGRYLENMARVLGLEIGQIGDYWQEPVELNTTCAIFGETELISKVAEGYSPQVIAAGVNKSIFSRLAASIKRLKTSKLVFCGGLAGNKALAFFIRERFDLELIVPPRPTLNGAIGAALLASKNS